MGSSLGDRKPLPKGATRVETLPISTIVLTLSEQANSRLFRSHWEDVTGLMVNEALVASLPAECSAVPSASANTVNDPYYPKDFFEQSRSKRALPFTASSLRARDYSFYLSQAKKHLPANPGDLLWLIDRFFTMKFLNGGHVDLISASLHNNSIFKLIAFFCRDAMYKHHPHLTTFLAFASMAEMGQDERNVSSNALTIACELLRQSTERKSKTANFADKTSASRYVIKLAGDVQRPQGAIRAVEEPILERDVEILTDITDDEAEPDEGSPKPAGHVEEPMSSDDDDDDILFPKPATLVSDKKGKGKVEQVAGQKKSDNGHGRAATEGMKRRRDDSDDEAESSKSSTKAPRHTSTIKRRHAL